MTKGQPDQAKPRKRRIAAAQQRVTLAAHPLFAPLLGIWGAALGGLPIMVLPTGMIVTASTGTALALLGGLAQAAVAGLAALVLGGTLFGIAKLMNDGARPLPSGPSIAAFASRQVKTIDPLRDLGSVSFDAPVEDASFAVAAVKLHAAARRDALQAAVPASPEPAPVPVPVPVPAPADDLPPPQALDLASFATLPGRNGVWVEAPPAAQPLRLAPVPANHGANHGADHGADHGAAALARLRAVPAHELSILQMVERFAAALHEHRAAAPGSTAAPRDLAAREAALAEALHALAALNEESATAAAAPNPGEPLRDALARLHGLRGAA